MPRGGGIPILAAFAICAVVFLPMTMRVWGVVAGAIILGLVGIADDKYEEKISPYVRLVFNVLAAMCVIGVGIGIAYVTNPFGGVVRLDLPRLCGYFGGSEHCIWVLSDVFALIWLVGMQNIVGWSSGVDGQMPGFVVIAALTMAALGLRYVADPSQGMVVMMAGIVAGAYLGFLPWNWFPQKIMPGYGGKSLAGFLLGVLAILSGAKVGAMVLVLGIPIIDAVWVSVKRIREGRSPVWGGYEHLHHYLMEVGWGKRRIAVFYWFISGVLGWLALNLHATSKYFTMATTVLVISGTVIWFHYFSTYLKPQGPGNGLKT